MQDEDMNTPPEGTPIVTPPVTPPAPNSAGATATPPADVSTGPLDALRNWFGRQRGQSYDDSQESGQPATPPVQPTPRATRHAPRPARDNWFHRLFGGDAGGSSNAGYAPPEPVKERSAIEKMRDTVAEYDEDYKGMGERILGFFMQLVGYIGPFALVVFVGSDLGKYYTPVMDAAPAYGLAFTIEAIIAGMTIAMGRSFAEIASGKANWGKAVLVIGIWLILNASSAFGLYLVITKGGEGVTGLVQIAMFVRVGAIALGDLGCSAMLMFKGQSMQKHIESIKKRATAIGELADAQRGIEEADKNAALREQMMKSTLKIQEDLSTKIGDAVSMVMESILDKMEKSLKDDEPKKGRQFGDR